MRATCARADVEILPDPLFSQRPQHKNIQTNGLSTEIFTDVSRALLRIMGKPILRTPAATPASGVHLMGRTWPLGVTKRSDCVVSPAPVITVAVHSPPRRGRGGAEGATTSDRARFLIPRTASWFQLSSRVSTLLLMLWEGGWEWAGPSDSFELANLTPPPPPFLFPINIRVRGARTVIHCPWVRG